MNPTKVITIYSTPKNNEIYIESQEVTESDNVFELEQAKPFSIKELRIFQRALMESEIKSKLKEGPFYNVIYINTLSLIDKGINKESFNCVWYSHERTQFMFFPKSSSIKSDTYHLPKLVWKYSNSELQVYVAFDEQITSDTPLYGCPFMNVYDSSVVCLGSTALSIKHKHSVEEAKNSIMSGFFASQFTHFNSSVLIRENPNLLYGRMLKKVPLKSHLKDLKLKVKDLCRI
jgi:PRTRC genetic system protein B